MREERNKGKKKWSLTLFRAHTSHCSEFWRKKEKKKKGRGGGGNISGNFLWRRPCVVVSATGSSHRSFPPSTSTTSTSTSTSCLHLLRWGRQVTLSGLPDLILPGPAPWPSPLPYLCPAPVTTSHLRHFRWVSKQPGRFWHTNRPTGSTVD